MPFTDHHHAVSVRKAGEADLSLLVDLGRRTFYEAFRDGNTKEDMDLFLRTQFQEPVLREELREPGAVFFLAFQGAEPLGFTKVRTGYEPPELLGLPALEVERIYVLREHQDKKIGSILMEHDIGYARSLGFSVVWLGVWENNFRAIRFYERRGFLAFGSHPFVLGRDTQTDILMKLNI